MGITSLFMYLFACHPPRLSLAHAHQSDHRFHENRTYLFQNHISVLKRVHALNSCWWRTGEQANTQEGVVSRGTIHANHLLQLSSLVMPFWDVLGLQDREEPPGDTSRSPFAKILVSFCKKENIFLLPLATSNQHKGLMCICSVLRIVISAMIRR